MTVSLDELDASIKKLGLGNSDKRFSQQVIALAKVLLVLQNLSLSEATWVLDEVNTQIKRQREREIKKSRVKRGNREQNKHINP